MIVAIEHSGRLTWVGASEAGLLWERFFKESLGIPAKKVLRLHPLDADAERMRAALRRVAALSGAGGRAWFVFIGLAAKDSLKQEGQVGVLAGFAAFSENNRAPWRDRGLHNTEIVTLLGAGKGTPIVVVDAAVDADVKTSVGNGDWTATTEPVALPAPGRGIVLGRIAKNDVPHTYPGTVIPAFSYLLLGALRGWGDRDHDGRVTADEAWQYAGQRLAGPANDASERRAERPDERRGTEVLSHGIEPEPACVSRRSSDQARDALVFNRDGLVLPELPRQPHHVPVEWEDKTYMARCYPHGWAPGEAPLEETGGDVDGAYRQCPGGTSVGIWADAWCAQGGSRCGNRFALKANDLCTLLTRYGEQKRRLVVALARDWPALEAALALASAPQEKARILRAFRGQYPMLSELGLEGALERTCARYVEGGVPASAPTLPAGAQWVTIAGGAFKRGRSHSYREWVDFHKPGGWWLLDDRPADWVLMHSFQMLKSEVTVAQYRRCVEEGPCSPPRPGKWPAHRNYETGVHENHPVNHVNWAQAKAFCDWIGGRLPSEAEWDYAASSRGTHVYPWGNQDTCAGVVKFQVYDPHGRCGDENSGTSPVCSRPSGNSKQGLCDLMGNVWEWLADKVHPNYCGAPADGMVWTGGSKGGEAGRRMARGGSWRDEYTHVGMRVSVPADRGDMDLGFRCVRDR
ncbi:MAG: formylglycine-generating enzyme family protein [Deltaproteobacteria bacterium]|nr:formylglycine-generating enzyme family protein [Deltaproteobacteria bacterium]